MISRVFVKELLGFKSIDLEFNGGLVVITGPSGAGKSVFINTILANFALQNQEARVCEVEINKPDSIESNEFDFDDDLIVIKSIKKDRVRYFVDGQNISKKALKELFKDYVSYISVRDKSGFENEKLIEIIDNYILKNSSSYRNELDKYKKIYNQFIEKRDNLSRLENKIKESNERVEFLKFEIDKIKSIAPKEGEYEELLVIKKQLSKIDKINELSSSCEAIFDYEDRIYELFSLLDKDSSYVSDAMNQLRSDFEDIENLTQELEDVDIEGVLNRLEELSNLIKRFGSISEALIYLKEKEEELASFDMIESDLSSLKDEIKSLEKELNKLSSKISKKRVDASKKIEKELSTFLKELKLPNIKFNFKKSKLYNLGVDEVELSMGETKIESLSGGEFNRVRLALLSVSALKESSGVIFLDEIDANVSGDESIAIANMISNLSKSFQIFAISHQPHLSSKANEHILVTKDTKGSHIKKLYGEDRVKEIARIIGGESYTQEALDFAKNLFK